MKKASFCSTEEQKAIELISSLAPTGYSVVRNQPYKTKDGVVQVYKCSGKNRHGCGFQAKLIYFCPELDGKLEVFVAGDHWHPKPSKHTIGLPPVLKPIVSEGVKDGLLPAQIHRKIIGQYPKAAKKVTLAKVQTAAKHQAKKLLSSLKGNTIGDLYAYLSENTLSGSSEKHQFGVLKGWKANGPEDVMSEAAGICFVMTTKNLLQNVRRQALSGLVSFVDVDQTYSLNEKGYPVTVVGTVNRNHNFKLVAVGVSRYENEVANKLILDTIEGGLKELINFEWSPKVAMSDRAGAISNAFKALFTCATPKLAKCYFHVKKGLKDNKWRFSSEKNYEQFEKDCSALGAFDQEDEFLHGLRLLDKKWRSREKAAMDWFLEEWGTELYRCWFSGFTPAGLPNTNNAVERFNRALKTYVTSHQRLSFSKLITKFKRELVYQSLLSKSSDFPAVPLLNRQAWGKAQLWYKFNKTNILECRNNMFFVPTLSLRKKLKQTNSLSRKNLTEAFHSYDCSASPLPNENFDKYLKRRRSFWKIQKTEPSSTAPGSFSCNCPKYLQKATCKHSLGLSIGYNFVVVPPNWKCNSIEALKQRGRPRKVKKFMEHDVV